MILRSAALALVLCTAAHAASFAGDSAAGTLEFSATQADARFDGAFKRFRAALDFDPAQPALATLDVWVETAYLETQDAERDEILRGPDFFWVQKHPQAVFHARGFKSQGETWQATGELKIRGVTKSVPVTFTLTRLAAATVVKGVASLKRLDFGLGQGEWASTEWVGNVVDIRFEVRLAPVG
jgi:polyisoprenoid-binding protein YceI